MALRCRERAPSTTSKPRLLVIAGSAAMIAVLFSPTASIARQQAAQPGIVRHRLSFDPPEQM
jgi:hypothetical protein